MSVNNFFMVLCLVSVCLLGCSSETDSAAQPVEVSGAVEESSVVAEVAEEPVSALESDPVFVAGKAVYNRMCVACHQPNGKGIPPAFPSIYASDVVTGDLDGQINLILNGVSGSAMVAFGPQLSDEDIAAVITYQRNAFGNSTGDIVTPEQVAALR